MTWATGSVLSKPRIHRLAVIDAKLKTVACYFGRCCTHVFLIETDITREKVERMRALPEKYAETGE